MSLRTSDYDYTLPDELIARYPAARRDESRMMVLHRADQRIEHRMFGEFPSFTRAGDIVVLNDTRVVPARAFSDDGRIEFLFLEALAGELAPAGLRSVWKCLVKPGRRMRVGAEVRLGGIRGQVIGIEPDGERIIAFESAPDLEKLGELPLPPYFGRSVETADAERYQTVYAQQPGSVAAPTAGLHFTPEVLAHVPHTFLTLHVGVGTFRPVQVDNLAQHRMHSERFSVSADSAVAINCAKRVIAVGTTSARVLESIGRPIAGQTGETNIFIHPPYQPRVVDVLLTNFHLPKSTLLMLVSAFAGREFVLRAYQEAMRERYRFYSYGDCMLII